MHNDDVIIRTTWRFSFSIWRPLVKREICDVCNSGYIGKKYRHAHLRSRYSAKNNTGTKWSLSNRASTPELVVWTNNYQGFKKKQLKKQLCWDYVHITPWWAEASQCMFWHSFPDKEVKKPPGETGKCFHRQFQPLTGPVCNPNVSINQWGVQLSINLDWSNNSMTNI